MYVKLGFAVAVYCQPDILLIDEVLAVGDIAFQAKCFDKLNHLKGKGVTIVLVSHDMNKVAQYSDEVLMLDGGRLSRKGETMKVISSFRTLMNEHYVKASRVDLPDLVDRFGSGEAEITDAILLDEAGQPVDTVYTGRKYIFKVSVVFHGKVVSPIVGFVLSSPSNKMLCNTHSFLSGQKLGTFEKNEQMEVSFGFEANLLRGVYQLTPAISYADGVNFFDYRNRFVNFRVIDDGLSEGIVYLNANTEIRVYGRREDLGNG
jgi:hypothetical protein